MAATTLTATLNGTVFMSTGIPASNAGTTTQENAGEVPLPPSPQDSSIPTVMEDDPYIYEDDPMHMVMDMLNFSVVPKKPSEDAPFSPLPPGELMPKSQYIKERQSLFQWIKRLRSELVAAQVDKINVLVKSQETEQKMEKLVKVIAELHSLYGEFIRSFLRLMTRKNSGVEGVLTVGPFGDGEEVDRMLSMLKGLANLFQSDFENLGVTKQAMREINEYLGGMVKTLERRGEEMIEEGTSGPTPPPSQVTTMSSSSPLLEAELRQGSAISCNSFSDGLTMVVNDEDLSVQIGVQNDGVECNTYSTTETSDQVASAPPVPVSTEVPRTVNCEQVTPAANDSVTTTTLTSAFEPVASQSNGKILYTLVEYPKQLLNLVGTKHAIDTAKTQQSGSKGLYCTCGQVLSTPALFKYHIRYFNAKWRFMCKLCGKRYPGINFLKLHMLRSHKIVHAEGQNGCSYCSKSFETANELLRHLESEHNKQAPVDHVFPSSSRFKESPALINTSVSSITNTSSTSSSTTTPAASDPKSVLVVNGTRCACGLELGTKEALISHIRLEAEEQGQFFKCTMCEDAFNHPCNLKSHFQEKHGLAYQDFQNRQYGCPNCDKTFESYEDLESHIICTHQMLMDEEEETVVGMDGLQVKNLSSSEENAPSSSQNRDDSTLTFHIDSSDYDDGQGTCFPVDTEPPQLIILDE